MTIERRPALASRPEPVLARADVVSPAHESDALDRDLADGRG